MDPKKKEWADLILKGKAPVEAAMIVWPGTVIKTARNKASLLGKDEDVQGYLRDSREKIDTIVTETLITEIAEKQSITLLSSARKREILEKIAEGKHLITKTIVVDGRIKKVKVKPDFRDIMKAIDLDNRMSGDLVQAKRNEIKKAEETKRIIIVEDQTPPPAPQDWSPTDPEDDDDTFDLEEEERLSRDYQEQEEEEEEDDE